MTAAEAIAAAEQEGLTLLRARNDSGFLGVYRGSSHMPWSNARPFQATLWDRWIDGRMHYLGCFATAEQAALVVARAIRYILARRGTQSRTGVAHAAAAEAVATVL